MHVTTSGNRCFLKKKFSKIFQSSLENTYVGVFFLKKLPALGEQLNWKKTPVQAFLWILQNFNNMLFAVFFRWTVSLLLIILTLHQ